MERFAQGAWLDRPVLRLMSLAMAGLTLAIVLFTLATRSETLDLWGRPIGTDFTMIWSAGGMALEGHAADVYDWTLHAEAQRAAHRGAEVGFAGWHYPPFFLLVAALVATLPYLPALIAWQLATGAAALAVAYRILPGRDTVLAALGFPAVFVCLGHGHNAFLTAALFGGGLLLLERRPVLAGMLLGCVAYKPQLGILIPVALVAGGHWRAVGGAALAVAALTVATLAAFGPEPWLAFLHSTRATRDVVLQDGATGWYKLVSAFAYVRMSGGSVPLAYLVQGVVTALVAASTAWLWRIGAAFPLRAAALLLGSLLATPYVLDYDMVVVGPAIAFLAGHGLRHGFGRWEKTALAFLWFVPLVARHLAFFAGLPAAFGAMAAVFCCILRQASAEHRMMAAPIGRRPDLSRI